ncbi:MAG: chain-length determining protein [Prevotella sp.]|nr:chain-length determining protein [Prevotella sp.]
MSKYLSALVKHKRTILRVTVVVFVLSCLILLSIPKYYKCQVMLAPEVSTSRTTSTLSTLARSFGMRLGNSLGNASEALYPTLYPELMNSNDFKTSLFPVKVREKDSEEYKTYYEYLLNDQRQPWWSAAIEGVTGAIGDLFSTEDTTGVSDKVDLFRLTKDQTSIAKLISKKIVCDVDKKTMVITIEVTDQDPEVCAIMADTAKARLQEFITAYRTNKSRVDLEYNKKLCAEAKRRYEHARDVYADFADANQDVLLQSVRNKLNDLENEMQLQYNAYTTYVAQMQNAEAKVQEDTPAFTTLQSATVPLKPAGPKKKNIVLVLLLLAFFGSSVWALHKEQLLKPLLGLS